MGLFGSKGRFSEFRTRDEKCPAGVRYSFCRFSSALAT